ncbi:hypothetical protein MUO14_21710 [Halobacillus shinanisalinarum]|uniref:Uncharacterized protein n=1 Tax=Halobacillus shinanisalinarum TaxID=2932258 RepID=A0ABY4GYI3_9BACI|nr:hypothetical protein [Halobacillus shinanisalinarum]UOQ92985.1 hypothetical protein MUO14_21710 [Halobacillus shinanisalinarum]
MSRLSSYDIYFNRTLNTSQIMNLYKQATKHDYTIYLRQNSYIADGGHLPKLLSFFLLVDIDNPVLLIIDGEDVNKAIETVQEECQESVDKISCRTNYTFSQINHCASITV